MKAIVQDRYGPPELLRLAEIEGPVPGEGDVLVRVRAASMHPDVWHVVTGRPYVLRLMGAGLRRPRQPVPGTDLAGVVESVGPGVNRLRPGDEVFGESVLGYPWKNGGAFAEYASVPERALVTRPANVSVEQAAAVPTSGIIALRSLREGGLRAGQKVLVVGAGGGVGSLAVQLAKAHGAHVTGVDAGNKLDLVRSLGAERVIDHTTGELERLTDRFDMIFDVPVRRPLSAWRRSLAPGGKYVFIGHDHYGAARGRVLGSLPVAIGLLVRSPFSDHLPSPSFDLDAESLLAQLRDCLASGQLTPHVDRTFPLAEVPQAMRYLASGRAKGKVVIVV